VLEVQWLACSIVATVAGGGSLDAVLAESLARHPLFTTQQRAMITDLCYGTLRFGMQLGAVLDPLLARPLRDAKLRWLLLVALYQLQHTRAAPYAIVDHAVSCAARLGHAPAGGLINAVLRNFLRRREALLAKAAQSEIGRYGYPQWWIEKLRAQYPRHFGDALVAGNLRPPLTLRVNRRRISRDEYLASLTGAAIAARAIGADGVMLGRARPVGELPGFAEGWISVQDAGAQLAAPLLDARAGMRVLDACAAPGGKTTHLLEIADLDLTALDADAIRLQRVRDNLQRLGLHAGLLAADATDIESWWDRKPFDRILADVPCSASGVVRRHPDIKWLRRASDIAQFVALQQRVLGALWQALASGGKLLYTTCSLFHEENAQQIARFLERHADARVLPLGAIKTLDGTPEGQLLPDDEHDGFFFALLQKL